MKASTFALIHAVFWTIMTGVEVYFTGEYRMFYGGAAIFFIGINCVCKAIERGK